MINRAKILLLVAVPLFTACGIDAVGVGEWDIRVALPEGELLSVWTITADERISISGESIAEVDEVELAGSRMAWSAQTSRLTDSSGQQLGVNFGGTVNGNRLEGTLYSTAGNFTVSGVRR